MFDLVLPEFFFLFLVIFHVRKHLIAFRGFLFCVVLSLNIAYFYVRNEIELCSLSNCPSCHRDMIHSLGQLADRSSSSSTCFRLFIRGFCHFTTTFCLSLLIIIIIVINLFSHFYDDLLLFGFLSFLRRSRQLLRY